MKKIIALSLSFLIGAVFILSAASKIVPMEPFEFQFVDLGVATWKTAPYIARFFISLEFFLGMLLLFHISIRKFTSKFAIALLLFFTGYLAYKIIIDGNTGNCGCFGVQLKMTPLQGIIKNVVLIFASSALYVVSDEELWNTKWKKIILPVMAVISLCLGFLIYPVDVKLLSSLDKNQVNYKVPLWLMYTNRQQQKPKTDLTKGKHIIAFLSLTCPHCRIAAEKMHVMHKKNPSIPFYFVLNGDPKLLPLFFDDTHTADIPHNLFLGPNDWLQVAGMSLPVIMYIDNSVVIEKHDGIDLDQGDIEEWLKSGK